MDGEIAILQRAKSVGWIRGRERKIPAHPYEDSYVTVCHRGQSGDALRTYEMCNFSNRLQQLINSDVSQDLRAQLGFERGGRGAARSVIDEVLRA
jgi:hypothetical protein